MSGNDIKVHISNAKGTSSPPNGIVVLPKGIQTFAVASPYLEEYSIRGWNRAKWKRVWNCTGFTGTGSIPAKGVGTTVTVPLTEESTLTWNWVGGQMATQVLSIAAFIFVICLVAWTALSGQHAFILALSAGALGGLAHEIVQSGGKFLLPGTDESGNFVLGGLIGIILGATAGLLMYQGKLVPSGSTTQSVGVSMTLLVEALVAGLALKGVADAPNPKQK